MTSEGSSLPGRSARMRRVVLVVAALSGIALCIAYLGPADLQRSVALRASEFVGDAAGRVMQERSNKYVRVPDEVEIVADNIFRIGGVGHSQLVTTAEGSVVFDTGLSLQAAKQVRLLSEVSPGPPRKIVLSHSHADHIGGVRFWDSPDSTVVAHRQFPEEQRYLTELQPFFYQRNRQMFPWMPESPPDSAMLSYGGVEPDVLVSVDEPYRFELGGVEFVVLAMPGGAEGADNLVMWLPGQKVLFTGDTLGPMFPQFPNLVTLRGEKFRPPVEYIDTLERLLALNAEILIPSHNPVVRGAQTIHDGLQRIRDAVTYVHEQTVAGMNAGKTKAQLMRDIRLPPELELTQSHGKIAWAVRGIWEYYATWFDFESTTELYPVPVRDVYAEVGRIAGQEALLSGARSHLDKGEAVLALHLLEIALAAQPNSPDALRVRLEALQHLLTSSEQGFRVDYEMYYLRRRIESTRELLNRSAG